MSDEKRPRAQSQTERDLEGLEARAQRERAHSYPVGVPILSDSDDDFTPVRNILETFATEFADSPRMQQLVVALWRHSANQEQRFRDLTDTSAVDALRQEVAVLNDQMIDIRGIDGKNGKVGTIRSDVDKLLSRAWWLISLAIGGIGAASAKLLFVGSTFGQMTEQLENNSARLTLIESVLFLRSLPGKAPQ